MNIFQLDTKKVKEIVQAKGLIYYFHNCGIVKNIETTVNYAFPFSQLVQICRHYFYLSVCETHKISNN